MSTTDGGPAFPLHCDDWKGASYGMSLRDYFAAKAMQGWVSSESMRYNDENLDHAAKFSYAMADAMLKARGESRRLGMKPDWKDAPPDAMYLAMDVNENWWWYTREPYFSETEGCWLRDSGLAYPAHIKNNQLEAEESLEHRPSTTTTTIERGV